MAVVCVPSFIAGAAHQKTDVSAAEWRTVQMRVTAYCPCSKCCGEYADGVTASGHKIQPGDTFVAADKRYSFNTEMVVPGYSFSQPVKVLDRGGAIKDNRLDLFFHTHAEALEWGVQYLDVQVSEG
jgi:3D (Asp-Asp-Asp) domain-containing protein